MLNRSPARHALPLILALAAVVAAGCGGDDAASSDTAVTVVATTTQAADLARAVGGDRAEVHGLLKANSDPHGYEPRPSDVTAVADADLIVRSGGDLDEWAEDLVDAAGGDPSEIELIESVETIEGGGHDHGDDDHEDEAEHADDEHADDEEDHGDDEAEEHADDGHADEDDDGHGETDPHWWQNPRNAILAVAAIEAALTEVDPGGAAEYERNAAAYRKRLERLDASVERCIERIPERRRRLVTTHDALGYYADRYGIEVVGALIPSLSTAAQPSAGDTQELVDQIRRQDVAAIFPESSMSPKLERAVSRETGARVGDRLWADTLGPEGSSGETYIGSIQANTAAIVDGLTAGSVACRPEA